MLVYNPLDAPLLGLFAEVLQGDGVKVLQESRRCLMPDVSSHAMYSPDATLGCCLVVAETEDEIEITLRGPDNVPDLDLLGAPSQVIPSRGSPDTLDNSSPLQLLEDLFDVSWRDALPG